jgi:hypothetical protein
MTKRLSARRTLISGPFCLCAAADCYCAGAVAAGASAGLPVRRVCRRSWRLWRRSLRWLRRPFRRCAPCVPVASAEPVAGAVGFGTAGAASCASATDGSSTPESAKPSVAPKPSRESSFRRETFSISTSLFRGFSSPGTPIKTNAPERLLNIRWTGCAPASARHATSPTASRSRPAPRRGGFRRHTPALSARPLL